MEDKETRRSSRNIWTGMVLPLAAGAALSLAILKSEENYNRWKFNNETKQKSIQADPTDPANVGLSPDQLKIKGLREFKEELGESKLRELESYFRGSLAGDASQGGWRTTNWDSVHTPLKVPASHTGSVPSGTQYPRSLSVSGGSGHYTWKLTTGALPPSLILTSSGSFSGTITAPPGSYTCTAEVNDGYTTATVPITLTIT